MVLSPQDGASAAIRGIEALSPEFFLDLPCGTARAVFEYFLAKPSLVSIRLAQEEEGVAILRGEAPT